MIKDIIVNSFKFLTILIIPLIYLLILFVPVMILLYLFHGSAIAGISGMIIGLSLMGGTLKTVNNYDLENKYERWLLK